MDHRSAEWKAWHWCAWLGLVTYIALIGIFAIEELDGRDETMRVLLAEEARIGAETARGHEDRSVELDALRALRQRTVALVVSGAVSQRDRRLTLREIQCDLVKLRSPAIVCPEPLPNGTADPVVRGAATFFLKELSAVAGSGQILGVLIITASIGGALITLSLRRSRTESSLRTVLRAMGGGIVCYLAVDGGTIPLTAADVARATHPATASLYGLLAGMFSERVFRLLSDLVDAFLARLTPASDGEVRAVAATPARESDARAPDASLSADQFEVAGFVKESQRRHT
jgi:hypothetical protein